MRADDVKRLALVLGPSRDSSFSLAASLLLRPPFPPYLSFISRPPCFSGRCPAGALDGGLGLPLPLLHLAASEGRVDCVVLLLQV